MPQNVAVHPVTERLGPREARPRPPRPSGVQGRVFYPLTLASLGELGLYRRLRQLEELQWWSPDRLHSFVDERLAQILTFAAANVPFYASLGAQPISPREARSVLSGVPYTTKSNLQSDLAALRARSLPWRVTTKTTGGSTGQAVTVLKDHAAMAAARAVMWLGYGWHGIAIGDRCARFWGVPQTGLRRLKGALADLAMNRMRFSAFAFDDADLARYWDAAVRGRPAYLYGYASMLSLFAEFVARRGLDGRSLGLKAVISTSEVLGEPDRARIQSTFGAPCRVEYGCGEIGPMAYECELGSLHLIVSESFVEVLAEDGTPTRPGEVGAVVVTDLNNRAMPLIRYQIGDYARVGDTCSCGRAFPVLHSIWGRAYDYVVSPAGKRYHGEFFMYIIEELRERGVGLRGYQIVQEQEGVIEVAVVPGGTLKPGERALIGELFRQRIPDVAARIVERGEIPRAPSGKAQVIRNLLPRANGAVNSSR